jgi:hypothetical protein
MITLLLAPLPIVLSLFNPSLPELVALALVLLIALAMALILVITLAMALVLAMAGTVNSTVNITSARKQQNLIKPSVANRVIETSAFRLAMPSTRRHAASTSMYAQPTRPWVGRSSRKGSWFTLAAAVWPLNLQKLRMADAVNPMKLKSGDIINS